MSGKPPYICEAKDSNAGRPATFIFLHGWADDAEGIPLGLAQQFQWHSKLPYLRWVLPNAPVHPQARERGWYTPKALPNAFKPSVPGRDGGDDGDDDAESSELDMDDEEGIMASVDRVDELIQAELDRGIDPSRIIIGGFSQGCAVSLVWGLTGRHKDNVAAIVAASGYFPLTKRISAIREQRGLSSPSQPYQKTQPETSNIPSDSRAATSTAKKWLLLHGGRDILVPRRLFQHEQDHLRKWVDEADIESHIYDTMDHSTCNAELRDILLFLEKVIPA